MKLRKRGLPSYNFKRVQKKPEVEFIVLIVQT